jgi:hypothetical protein
MRCPRGHDSANRDPERGARRQKGLLDARLIGFAMCSIASATNRSPRDQSHWRDLWPRRMGKTGFTSCQGQR